MRTRGSIQVRTALAALASAALVACSGFGGHETAATTRLAWSSAGPAAVGSAPWTSAPGRPVGEVAGRRGGDPEAIVVDPPTVDLPSLEEGWGRVSLVPPRGLAEVPGLEVAPPDICSLESHEDEVVLRRPVLAEPALAPPALPLRAAPPPAGASLPPALV